LRSAFDFTGASPPCQHYTSLRFASGEYRNADLIGLTREALKKTGKPWALENVVGAPLRALIDLRLDLKLIALGCRSSWPTESARSRTSGRT
jgi:hypothetical protein